MIAVCIATYNHEQYISQCIDSVLAQQCDEPIHIYIGDDSSTDSTSAICKQYAIKDNRIAYFYRETNMGVVNNTIALYRQIMADECEYIAMLDGDDYWTDPHKLQLQIDYLRAHPECGFVHTNGRTLSNSNTWTFGQREGIWGLHSVGFANCTVLFRSKMLSEELLKAIEAQRFLWIDYPLYGVFYQQTQWAYLAEQTAIWRDHISVSQPKTAQAVLRLRKERCRMWEWLDSLFPGKVGYTAIEAQNYLWEQRMNLIYLFNDRSLITPDLLNTYKPRSWKQKIKLIGLKNGIYYTILRKFCKKFA